MKDLFERTTINGLTIENRSVRSATWEGGIYCVVEKKKAEVSLKKKGGRQ